MKLHKKQKRKLIALISTVVLLFGVYFILCFAKDDNTVWENVIVNGVPIAGMTADQAKNAVESSFEKENKDAAFTVRIDGQEFSIPVYKTLTFDAGPVVADAYRSGHRSWILRGFDFLDSQVTKLHPENHTIRPEFSNDDALKKAIAESGIADYNGLEQTTWEIDGTDLLIHKGKTGVTPKIDALTDMIRTQINDGKISGTIDCPVETVDFDDVDFDAISLEIRQVSKDPYMNERHEVVPAQTGYELNPHTTRQLYEEAAEGSDVFVPLTVTEPSMTTEEYKNLLFRDLLGGMKSVYYSLWGRNQNLTVATTAVNGSIVMPGETFSYMEKLGDITYEKGYQYGDAYINGDVTSTLGGGVCQVASTIFASCLQTNLEIVQRRCHSMLVSYLPMGMDATFYPPNTDFKFKNNRDYPVRVDAVSDGGTVYIEIYGTKIEGEPEVEPQVFRSGLHAETYRYYYAADDTEHTDPIEKEYIGPSSYAVHP